MRRNVVQEKPFLKKVYSSKTFKPLKKAEEKELKALAFAVHLVVTKKVPLTKKIIKFLHKLKKVRIEKLLQFFGTKDQVFQLVKASRPYQIKTLSRFIKIIRVLLSAFFAPDQRRVTSPSSPVPESTTSS